MLDVSVVKQGKCVKFDFVFFAGFDGFHYLIETALPRMADAIVIVKFFRAVDADTDEKLIVVQEPAPLVIEQNCIGLKCVTYCLAGAAVFFL